MLLTFDYADEAEIFCIFLHAGSLSRIFSTEKEPRTYKIVQQGHLVWLICLWFITRSTKSSKLLYSLFMICIFPRWGTPLPAWKDMLMLMEESFPLSLILVRPLVRLKMNYLNHIYRCYFRNDNPLPSFFNPCVFGEVLIQFSGSQWNENIKWYFQSRLISRFQTYDHVVCSLTVSKWPNLSFQWFFYIGNSRRWWDTNFPNEIHFRSNIWGDSRKSETNCFSNFWINFPLS